MLSAFLRGETSKIGDRYNVLRPQYSPLTWGGGWKFPEDRVEAYWGPEESNPCRQVERVVLWISDSALASWLRNSIFWNCNSRLSLLSGDCTVCPHSRSWRVHLVPCQGAYNTLRRSQLRLGLPPCHSVESWVVFSRTLRPELQIT